MELLIHLLVVVIVAGVVYLIITMIPMDARFKQIALILLAAIVLIYLLLALLPLLRGGLDTDLSSLWPTHVDQRIG